jgi:hypothetical protein
MNSEVLLHGAFSRMVTFILRLEVLAAMILSSVQLDILVSTGDVFPILYSTKTVDNATGTIPMGAASRLVIENSPLAVA